MSRAFKNPANGYIEKTGIAQSFVVIPLCAPYLAIKGLWSHFVVVMLFIAIPTASTQSVAIAFFVSLILGIFYSFFIQDILAKRYLRSGWTEVSEEAHEISKVRLNVTDGIKTMPRPTHRKCPECAEEILVDAVKCKHCGSSIEKYQDETVDEAAKRLGITTNGTHFFFGEHTYTRIEDAIDYATSQQSR